MFFFTPTLLALLAFTAHANTACAAKTKQQQSYYPSSADCVEYMVPISVSPSVIPFNIPKWKDDYELSDFLAVAATRQLPNSPPITGKAVIQPATYQIAASFCSPKKRGEKAKTVILATHGIGQARSHWNSPFRPKDYNFVQFAVGQGYSVFFYDRLGQGYSEKVSGFMNQINVHAEVLKELSKVVRSGQYTKTIGKPSRLVLQGFSFGSYITHAAIGTSPEIADAVVLTAIGLNGTGINANGLLRSFVPRIANQQNKKFKDFDDGYLTWVDKYAQIILSKCTNRRLSAP